MTMILKIVDLPLTLPSLNRDVAQPGSAHVWGACGRWFESSRPDKQNPSAKLMDFAFKGLSR
jgi:hypothetical protein